MLSGTISFQRSGSGFLRIDSDDAVVGSAEVRSRVESVLVKLRVETGLGADHDRSRFLAGLLVIEIAARPAVVHDEHQGLAVRKLEGLEKAGGLDAVAEDLLVLLDGRSDAVEADPRAHLPRTVSIVETFAALRERHRGVERPGEPVRQIGSRLEVAKPHLDLVLPSVAKAVEEVLPVGGEREDVDPGRMVGAQGMRVENDLVGGGGVDRRYFPFGGRGPAVDDGKLVRGPPQREILELPALPREADFGLAQDLSEPRTKPRPPLRFAHDPLGVGVLGLDPLPGLGALLVLEPSIGVDELDALERLSDLDPFRLGRGGSGRGAGDGEKGPKRKHPRLHSSDLPSGSPILDRTGARRQLFRAPWEIQLRMFVRSMLSRAAPVCGMRSPTDWRPSSFLTR